MKIRSQSKTRVAAALALAAAVALPTLAGAQSTPTEGKWQFAMSSYAYLPTIKGSSAFPTSAGAPPIDVSVDQIMDALKMTYMGTLSATNGRWGGFADVLYINVGGNKTSTRDFALGGHVPAGVTADLSLDLKSVIWTLGVDYRLVTSPTWVVDAFGGARMAKTKQEIDYTFTGNLGTGTTPPRQGHAAVEVTNWDGLVGVKGRYTFGDRRQWAIPFYVDMGAGDSEFTWQGATGVTYALKWGELALMWRYLEYQMKSGKPLQEMKFSGPMFGFLVRF